MVSRYALTIAVAVLASTHASDVADLLQIKEHNFESINKTGLLPLIVAPKAAWIAKEFLAGGLKVAGSATAKAQTAHHLWHIGTAAKLAFAKYTFGQACELLIGSIIGTVFENSEKLANTAAAYRNDLANVKPPVGPLSWREDYPPVTVDLYGNILEDPNPQYVMKNQIWETHYNSVRRMANREAIGETFLDQMQEAVDEPTSADMAQEGIEMLAGTGIDALSPVLFKGNGAERGEAASGLENEVNEGLLVARLMANTIDCCYFNLFPHEECKQEAYDILKDFLKDKGAEMTCEVAGGMIGL